MEDLKKSAATLTDQATEYVNTFIQHTRVRTTMKATNVISESLAAILVTCFFIFCFLFAGIGAGLWIGHRMNNMEVGFFIVAGAYLLIGLILLLFKKQITMPLKNFIVRKIYE
jgi:hypothetical protein